MSTNHKMFVCNGYELPHFQGWMNINSFLQWLHETHPLWLTIPYEWLIWLKRATRKSVLWLLTCDLDSHVKLRLYSHISRYSGMAKAILQGTVKGARRRGRQKIWEDNIKEWTGMEFGDSLRAAKDRKWGKGIVATLFVVPWWPLSEMRWLKKMCKWTNFSYFSIYIERP